MRSEIQKYKRRVEKKQQNTLCINSNVLLLFFNKRVFYCIIIFKVFTYPALINRSAFLFYN